MLNVGAVQNTVLSDVTPCSLVLLTSVSKEYTASFVRSLLVNFHDPARRHVPNDHLSSHRIVQKMQHYETLLG
jgi:hypothetical protein